MNQKEKFNLDSFFPYQVRLYYKAVSETVRHVYQEKYGLSVFEWRTIANLYDYEPLTAKEVVNRASIGKVNVSRAISSLIKRKYIEKHEDPTDRRRVLLCLTPAGRKMLDDLLPILKDAEREMLSGFSEEEVTKLMQMMQMVRDKTRSSPPEDGALDD